MVQNYKLLRICNSFFCAKVNIAGRALPVICGMLLHMKAAIFNECETLYTVLFAACRYICHQIPERSFIWAGVQLPLCARCSGIWSAFAGAMLICPLVRASVPLSISCFAFAGALCLNTISFISFFDTNFIRLFLGICIGGSAGVMIFQSITILRSSQ